MFGWLLGLFVRENTAVYHPRERRVYSYWNGQKDVTVDPMILYKKIMAQGTEIDMDMNVACSTHSKAPEAHANLMKNLRSIFELPPFEKGGLTELEISDLFDHFLSYCEDLKKNTNQSPTSSVPSARPLTSFQEGPPTPSSSGSGSTEDVSSTGKQESSPSVPESPSVP